MGLGERRPFPGGSVQVFAIADEGDTIDEFDADADVGLSDFGSLQVKFAE